MKLLLVAATPQEIQLFIDQKGPFGSDVEVLITGVGMVATAFALGKKLIKEKFDLAINAGIAGAFDRHFSIGDVVSVKEDHFSELGAEDNEDFIPIDTLGFGKSLLKPVGNFPFGDRLSEVTAITVNKVHGSSASIHRTQAALNPQIESMEGAAFFYACEQFALPCIQIRSISNYVEPRNRESWNIPLAIKNLNTELIQIVEQL